MIKAQEQEAYIQLSLESSAGPLSEEKQAELERLQAMQPVSHHIEADRIFESMDLQAVELQLESVVPLALPVNDAVDEGGVIEDGLAGPNDLDENDSDEEVVVQVSIWRRLLQLILPGKGVRNPSNGHLGGARTSAGYDHQHTSEQRNAWLAVDKNSLRKTSWKAVNPATSVDFSGTVEWCTARKQGYAVLRGMAVNKNALYEYQLWIIDEGRPKVTPVHAGLFNIKNPDAECWVKIQPCLPISQALSFMVTLERAGGVVVSKRKRVIALASLDS